MAENQSPINRKSKFGNPNWYRGMPAPTRNGGRLPKNPKTIVKKGLTKALADKVDVEYIADKLLERVEAGDLQAIQYVYNRIEGMPRQTGSRDVFIDKAIIVREIGFKREELD
jgi:hypothetical protein